MGYGLGRDHTKEELIEACKAANAHEFILEMEDGEKAGSPLLLKGRRFFLGWFSREPKGQSDDRILWVSLFWHVPISGWVFGWTDRT